MATSEIACTYASMILHDDGIPITAEKIATLLEAANVTVESYWPGLFARLAASKDLGELILNAGSGCSPAPAAAAPVADAAAAAAPAAEEKKKEEPEEESDEDMGISIFD